MYILIPFGRWLRYVAGAAAATAAAGAGDGSHLPAPEAGKFEKRSICPWVVRALARERCETDNDA